MVINSIILRPSFENLIVNDCSGPPVALVGEHQDVSGLYGRWNAPSVSRAAADAPLSCLFSITPGRRPGCPSSEDGGDKIQQHLQGDTEMEKCSELLLRHDYQSKTGFFVE